MSFPVSHLVVATALLLTGAAADIWKRKIPNAINAAVGLTGLVAQVHVRGWAAMGLALAAGFLTIGLLWVPWTKGRLGGGDAKMAGAAAIWIGLAGLPAYLLLAAVGGGLVAVVCYLLSSQAARREIRSNLAGAVAGAGLPALPLQATGGRRSVPYGVGAVLAALGLLWLGGRS
jgi:prepilin peptidase CpaA